MASAAVAHTYLPGEQPELSRLGRSFSDGGLAPRLVLRSSEGDVPLPDLVGDVVQHVVAALLDGRAVTVTPHDAVLTTQQAADLLDVTRPTLVRMLEDGKIPFNRVSSRRTLRLRDVLEYRERRKQEQYRILDEIAAPYDDEDLEYVLEATRRARKEVAQRKKRRRESGA